MKTIFPVVASLLWIGTVALAVCWVRMLKLYAGDPEKMPVAAAIGMSFIIVGMLIVVTGTLCAAWTGEQIP